MRVNVTLTRLGWASWQVVVNLGGSAFVCTGTRAECRAFVEKAIAERA